VDPREYSRQYGTKLRQAELASVQDYIAESGSLSALHSQVPPPRRARAEPRASRCTPRIMGFVRLALAGRCCLAAVVHLSVPRPRCGQPTLCAAAPITLTLPRSRCSRRLRRRQIKECDDILVAMEGMLGRFQSDLGNISTEIRSLQEQSASMSVRLRNRRAVQARGGRGHLHRRLALGRAGALTQGSRVCARRASRAGTPRARAGHGGAPRCSPLPSTLSSHVFAGAAGDVHGARQHTARPHLRHCAGALAAE
jgi:hypothetical protein